MATVQQVTACCEAFPETMGSIGSYWYRCPKCGAGSFYKDVETKNKYWPNEYEKSLEDRIAKLEQQIEQMKAEPSASVPGDEGIWEFIRRTSEVVERWPAWKKEGWNMIEIPPK